MTTCIVVGFVEKIVSERTLALATSHTVCQREKLVRLPVEWAWVFNAGERGCQNPGPGCHVASSQAGSGGKNGNLIAKLATWVAKSDSVWQRCQEEYPQGDMGKA